MSGEHKNRSVEFFDMQFRRQAEAGDYAPNPFEQAILPYLFGEVLDLGCGLGNLAMAAAEKGCRVMALDASPTAVADLARRAQERELPVRTGAVDLRHFSPAKHYDCVVSIGLLMFFGRDDALAGLARIKEMVRPGGVAAVNVLIQGTTYMDMFDPSEHYLFKERELPDAFPGWKLEYFNLETFPAPRDTVKRFCTVIARKPRA